MFRLRFYILLVLYSFILCRKVSAQDDSHLLVDRKVTDQTSTLSGSEIQLLSQRLDSLEETKGSQIIIVLVGSTNNMSIEEYTWELAESNKVGREDVDDGVVMLFAMNDRKMRIEVGYGLEGVLTDLDCKTIIEQIIVPQFKAGNYYEGINQGLNAVIKRINGEDLPAPTSTKMTEIFGPVSTILGLASMFLFAFVNHKLGFLKGMLVCVGGSSVLGLFLGGLVGMKYYAIGSTILYFIFSDTNGSSGPGRGRRGGRTYYGGGSYGGGFSGGGGFGGFSGGGGSFGGGGASGGW